MDSAIRFVTIFDTKDEKILYSEHNPGTTNLLSKEEVRNPCSWPLTHGKHGVSWLQR